MDAMLVAIIIVVVVALAALAAAAYFYVQNRRTGRMRERFGDEYDRTLAEHGTRAEAEADLQRRVERVAQLEIRPLTTKQAGQFLAAWNSVQTRFVDDPPGAVEDADRLIQEVMASRGYPVKDFDQRAADVSVYHPQVVANYRTARSLFLASRDGRASTDDMREGFVAYRCLFEDLLETRDEMRPSQPTEAIARAETSTLHRQP